MTAIEVIVALIVGVVGAAAGYFVGYNNRKKTAEAQIGSAEAEATRLVNEAIKTADQKRKEAVLEAKDEAFKLKAEVDAQKAEADKEIKQRRAEISRQENRIDQKENALDRKTEALERKEEDLKKRTAEADARLAEIDALRAKEMERLETLAGLSQEDAREVLLHKVDEELTHEKAVRIAAYETDLKENCDNIARNLIGQAVSRCAADHCSETTVSVVPLPSDEMKGRIIGREGRNIRALETATGVDLIIDDTPEAITLSSFDQTRREVARMTLERLIGDGRIHPARIEETVEKCRHELELQMKREGERAVMELGIHGLHPDLIKLIGRLKYRTSFGQNALTHSMEVAWVAGLLAGEMGVNVTMARRAGLLHDIGKALDHEIEGSHVQIGVDICRKYKENTQIIQMTRFCSGEATDAGFTARYKTNHTRLELAQTVSCRTEGFSSPAFVADTGDGVGVRCTSDASDAPIALEIAARLTSSRDVDPLLQLDVEPGWDFVSALAENQAAWEQKWADCDIVMEGDDDAQTALRYVIYQLAANCSPRDHTVSIGARGLTHTRYKGCYFWDTDLFLTPFYDLTDPQAARSLAGFRVGTLPQARAHAARMNGAGARYPWMVSYDGTEQCESWDIGCSEVHVTADVAYALGQYLDWTGDDSLFFQGGAQVLVETARFWVSRYSPAPEAGKVNLLFCKGPDEYCGITSNNLFTNAMVKHNLSLALTAAARLKKEAPEQYAALSLSKAECAAWEILRDAIQLPRDPITGHYRQDDTFHLLERVEPAELKSGDEASYHQVCFDRLQRYQVIKQADTLLLITRLPEQFTEEEKLAAWEDFEPLCIHDSTLSFASHALFAAQNGLAEAAEAYWRKALYLDLEEVMGNTGKEGLHLACLGETWNTVIFGFAGLHIENGVPKLSPHLPNGLVSMQFHFYYRGQRYEVQIAEGASKIFIAPNKS